MKWFATSLFLALLLSSFPLSASTAPLLTARLGIVTQNQVMTDYDFVLNSKTGEQTRVGREDYEAARAALEARDNAKITASLAHALDDIRRSEPALTRAEDWTVVRELVRAVQRL